MKNFDSGNNDTHNRERARKKNINNQTNNDENSSFHFVKCERIRLQ